MKPFFPDHWSRRHTQIFLLLLVVIAAGLKLGAAIGNEPINLDAVRYCNAANLVSQGRLMEGVATSQFMPLAPLFIWGAYLVCGDWVLAGQVVSVLFLSLAVIPVFFLTRSLFDTRIASWTAIAFTLSPPLTGYGAEILREPPFLFFFAWALYFAVQAFARGRTGDFILTGLFGLFAALCRLEGLLLPVVCVAWALILAWRTPARRVPLLRGAFVLGAPFLVLLIVAIGGGVSLLRLDYVTSLATELFSGEGVRGFLNARQSLLELEQSLPGGQWDNDFAQTARRFLPLIYLLGVLKALLDALFLPFGLLAVVGMWRRGKPGLGFIYLLAASYLLTAGKFLLQMNFVSDRYLLSAAVLLFPFAGAGFQQIMEKVGEWRRPVLRGVLVALFLLIPLGGSLKKMEAGDPTIRLAGEWLAGQDLKAKTLICNDERVPFYAGRWRGDYLRHSERDFSRMAAVAAGEEVDLMVIRVSARKRQGVAIPEGFGLLKEFAGEKDAVVLFRNNGPGTGL